MSQDFLSQEEVDALLKGVSGEAEETAPEETAGGVKPCKNGRPAASMSIAMAKGSDSCTSANFSRIVSISHGLMVGTPQPPFALSASAAPSTAPTTSPSSSPWS